MDVETALRQIDAANDKHVGGADYERQREAYESTLREVERVGGGDAVEELTTWVCEFIREEERRPDADAVDDRAARRLDERGEDVPSDSHLAG